MEWRLLPRDHYLRFAYVWLIYLASPIWFAVQRSHQPGLVAATAIVIAIFLPLYVTGQWARGWLALAHVAAIGALGALLVPRNPGGAVFLVYAAGFAYRVGAPRVAIAVLGAIGGAVLLEAVAGGMDAQTAGWTLLLTPVIGGFIIYSVETSRKLREAQVQAREAAVVAERERIGRDLHDLLGHTLSVIVLKSELASKLASRDPERAFGEIRDVERISREALAEVRRAVQGSGDGPRLQEELQRARPVLDAAGVRFDCDIAPVTLQRPLDHALAFAVREAVTNVVRHARAQRCAITLTTEGPLVQLSIEDDGIGHHASGGSGLAGMHARVAQFGGRLERDDQDGTRLTITVPTSA